MFYTIYLDSYHRHCIVSIVHVHFPTNPHLVITLLETHKKFPFQSNQFMCRCRSGVDVSCVDSYVSVTLLTVRRAR